MTEREEERAAVVAWLRDVRNQHEVINLTMAMSNGDVMNAMSKCADIIECLTHLNPKEDGE